MSDNLNETNQNATDLKGNHASLDAAQISTWREAQHGEEINPPQAAAENGTLNIRYREEKSNRKKDRHLKIFGGFCIMACIGAFIASYSPSVNTSAAARDALENKISTTLAAGVVLLKEDENMGQQDYTITHNTQSDDTKIYLWDYAAEDGDYVQVLVNGAPVGEAFMIKHKPKELVVPAVGEVQIQGVRDGGGGITYAVRYDLNGTNYFNFTPQGEFNTYTLIRE